MTPEPPARSKKNPKDIADPYAAIHRCHSEMEAHVANLRELHPETPCSDPVDPLTVKKDKVGAPIHKTAFHAPIIGLTRLAGFLGDLPPEEMPKQEAYDHCAETWADTSKHLGLTEKAAALFGAISETCYVVGFTAAKSVKRLVWGKPADDVGDPNTGPLTEERPEVEEKTEEEGERDADLG